ncbi:hypothetical protein D3C80_1645980 [compost metagenome]
MADEGLVTAVVQRQGAELVCIAVNNGGTGIIVIDCAESHIIAIQIQIAAAITKVNVVAVNLVFAAELHGRTTADNGDFREGFLLPGFIGLLG